MLLESGTCVPGPISECPYSLCTILYFFAYCISEVWNKHFWNHSPDSPSPYVLFYIHFHIVSPECGIDMSGPISEALVHLHNVLPEAGTNMAGHISETPSPYALFCIPLHIVCPEPRSKYSQTHFRCPSTYALFSLSPQIESLESGINICRQISKALVHMHIFVARARNKCSQTTF
jgi:hypothetical protein